MKTAFLRHSPERLTGIVFDLERWKKREAEMGEEYVAHKKLKNYSKQQRIVHSHIDNYFMDNDDVTFNHVCDFGCGSARFTKKLHSLAHEYTGIDILPGYIIAPYIRSKLGVGHYINFPTDGVSPLLCDDNVFDLFFTFTVLQHIVPDADFEVTCKEIKRITKKGCLFILFETVGDRAPHVIPRKPKEYADALGFTLEYSKTVDIDFAYSHWMITGRK